MSAPLSVALDRGFRPFFLCAALWPAFALGMWVAALNGAGGTPGILAARDWHVHELLFGFVPAVVAGFLLTAVPNWTARPALRGAPLAALVALWVVGRIAVSWPGAAGPLVLCAAIAFPGVLCVLIWREIVLASAWRNAVVCVLLTALVLGDAGFLAERIWALEPALSFERLALSAVALLIALVGGRVTPAFTRNWMKAGALAPLPGEFALIDRLALALLLVALLCWVAAVPPAVTALAHALAAIATALRIARWRGWASRREPLVLILHLGQAWLVVWLALAAAASAGWLAPSMATHALTTGVIGTMTLAIMTRASLGHGGRTLSADPITIGILTLVQLGAVVRVLSPLLPEYTAPALILATVLWAGAYLVFAVAYTPLLLGLGRDAPAKRPPAHQS